MRALQRALSEIEQGRPRPETELRRRAEIVRRQLSGLPAAVFIANDRGRYIDVNRAATVLTGYARAELLRMSLSDLTADVSRARGRLLWQQFVLRGRMSGIYPVLRKDGRVVRARYLAAANVLPGIHVSLLVSAPLVKTVATGKTRKRRK
jgi:PAS domain S-box-containing protein